MRTQLTQPTLSLSCSQSLVASTLMISAKMRMTKLSDSSVQADNNGCCDGDRERVLGKHHLQYDNRPCSVAMLLCNQIPLNRNPALFVSAM